MGRLGVLRLGGAVGGGLSGGEPDLQRRFEREPSAVPFDWQIQKVPGVQVTLDKAAHADGRRSPHLAFDGTANVTEVGVVQTVYLEPGHYTFRAQVRSDGLTTDQGCRLAFGTTRPRSS